MADLRAIPDQVDQLAMDERVVIDDELAKLLEKRLRAKDDKAEISKVYKTADGGEFGNAATIGQGAWTVVVDLPDEVNRFLDARWNGEGDGEPFEFELEVDPWLVAFVGGAR